MNRWRVLLWPTLAMLVALGILLSLGTWQMLRLYEKEALLARLNTVLISTPTRIDPVKLMDITITALAAKNTGTLLGTAQPGATQTPVVVQEFLRVTVTGSYIQARSIPVRVTFPSSKNAQSLGGLGFFWMTPFQVDGGPIVMINRGFVPAGPDTKAPPVLTPEGQQAVTGLMRSPETRQTFTPADQPQRGEYFIRDPKTMAEAVSIRQVALGFFIDAERTADGLTPPVGVNGGDMLARISNNHLQYAVTWYGFAFTLLGVFGFFARTRLREQAASASKRP